MASSPLPPTTNSLHASQRARLLKSTRKLTDVLGATPHVIDTKLLLLPVPKNTSLRQKRQGVQFYSSPNAASTSFISLPQTNESAADTHPPASRALKHRRRQKSTTDRPVVLRLHPLNLLSALDSAAQPSASYAIRLSLASVASPPSPLVSATPSTASADDGVEDNAESKIRRKRMAKLARTLGENVPSELLLSQCSQTRSSDEQQRKVIVTDDTEARPSTTKRDRRRTVSLVMDPLPPRTSSLARSASTTVPKTQRHEAHHRRAETEWNGEWNIEDAEKRAMALRNLRCR